MPSTPRRSLIRRSRENDPSDELLRDFPERLRGDRWRPAADIFETEDAIVVRLELPGVTRDELRVNVERDTIRIRGVRRPPTGVAARRLHRMEIAFGPFERRVQIPVAFESERVRACLDGGFLEVTVPKREAAKVRVEVDSA